MSLFTADTAHPVNIERGDPSNPSGMPRPLAEDKHGTLRPVPWTNRDDGWGILDGERATRCSHGSLCMICGEHVAEGRMFIAAQMLPSGRPAHPAAPVHANAEDMGFAVDGGPLHERCYRMTVAHCRTVRQDMLLSKMFAVRYTANLPAENAV